MKHSYLSQCGSLSQKNPLDRLSERLRGKSVHLYIDRSGEQRVDLVCVAKERKSTFTVCPENCHGVLYEIPKDGNNLVVNLDDIISNLDFRGKSEAH